MSSEKFHPSSSPHCPDFLESIVNRCFSIDPNERPTAKEIAKIIQQY